ncbi:MAG: hypothetical protein WB698_15525 [Solirubrobacteraceae bacterium]
MFEALPDEPLEPSVRPSEPEPVARRLGNGEVKRAVIKALAEANRPMRAADVHLAVERVLVHPISKNSVGWCLAAGAKGTEPRFERVSLGTYRLKHR